MNKEVGKEMDKEVNKEVGKEMDKEVNKEVGKEVDEEVNKEVGKEVDEGAVEELGEKRGKTGSRLEPAFDCRFCIHRSRAAKWRHCTNSLCDQFV